MNYARLTDEVRRHTRRSLEALGAEPGAELIETILIRDGYYCGRRFECDGFTAVWFVEENQMKIYRRDGSVHATQSVEDLTHERSREAA